MRYVRRPRALRAPRARSAALVAVALSLAVTLVSACTSDSDAPPKSRADPTVSRTGAGTPPSPKATPRKRHDPPLNFAVDEGVPMPRGILTLHEEKLYVVPSDRSELFGTPGADQLQIVDTGNGKVLGVVAPELGPEEKIVLGAADEPVVATVAGATLVLVAFVLDIPGHGTTQGRRTVELIAVDTVTDRPAWTLRFASLPDWGTGSPPRSVDVVDVRDGIAIIAVGATYDTRTTYAVDLSARRLLWQKKDFGAVMTGTGVVVGVEGSLPGTLVGRSLTDGKSRWSAFPDHFGLSVQPFAPDRLAVSADRTSGDEVPFRVLDATTGKRVGKVLPDGWEGSTCRYDGRDVTVCIAPNKDFLLALDARTAKDLWWLPDDKRTRVPPDVSAVWHGAIYGTTTNGPVVVDARTGKDRTTSLTVVPDLVDAYVGIVEEKNTDTNTAYPAIG